MNRILYASDCLDVLNDPDKLPNESVDLIYLDPPFNSKSTYNLPFKGKDRSYKPVEAFNDTWTWTDADDERLTRLVRDRRTSSLANIVKFAQDIEDARGVRGKSSLAAYLLNMTLRLRAMRRILKETGSIYLHCDPTASHYLKLVMDSVFQKKHYLNEVVWHYQTGGASKRWYAKKHDVILFYGKSNRYAFNAESIKVPRSEKSLKRAQNPKGARISATDNMKLATDVWVDIPAMNPMAKERLGYPTQKPLALLERIIQASTKIGEVVLDPFCGCGTSVHAAESLDRRWIGIDISKFSTGLIRKRIVNNFHYLSNDDITVLGVPETVKEARDLAQYDKFEFEKWVCGALDANGMYKNPGEKGADGGVDGVVELPVIRKVGNKFESQDENVVIQVKGGNVTPDSVKALSETVRRIGAIAGIMVCFKDQMGTVENQRSRETWFDAYQSYPVIQGFSIEDLLANERPNMPPTYGYRHGGRTSAVQLV